MKLFGDPHTWNKINNMWVYNWGQLEFDSGVNNKYAKCKSYFHILFHNFFTAHTYTYMSLGIIVVTYLEHQDNYISWGMLFHPPHNLFSNFITFGKFWNGLLHTTPTFKNNKVEF